MSFVPGLARIGGSLAAVAGSAAVNYAVGKLEGRALAYVAGIALPEAGVLLGAGLLIKEVASAVIPAAGGLLRERFSSSPEASVAERVSQRPEAIG